MLIKHPFPIGPLPTIIALNIDGLAVAMVSSERTRWRDEEKVPFTYMNIELCWRSDQAVLKLDGTDDPALTPLVILPTGVVSLGDGDWSVRHRTTFTSGDQYSIVKRTIERMTEGYTGRREMTGQVQDRLTILSLVTMNIGAGTNCRPDEHEWLRPVHRALKAEQPSQMSRWRSMPIPTTTLMISTSPVRFSWSPRLPNVMVVHWWMMGTPAAEITKTPPLGARLVTSKAQLIALLCATTFHPKLQVMTETSGLQNLDLLL